MERTDEAVWAVRRRPRAEVCVGGTHSPDTAWDALGCGWVLNVRLLFARDAKPASSDSGVSRFRQLGHSEPHACVCVCVCGEGTAVSIYYLT